MSVVKRQVKLAYFITHPDVVVDPQVLVPRWPLSVVGRERLQKMLHQPWAATLTAVYGGTEQKAIDGARILAEYLGLTPVVVEALGEIDRSSTGYLPAGEHAATADAFFADPDRSARGWETARAAQQRIINAVESIVEADSGHGNIALISHGTVATLYLCHVKRLPIAKKEGPPGRNGGAYYCFEVEAKSLVRDWNFIDD